MKRILLIIFLFGTYFTKAQYFYQQYEIPLAIIRPLTQINTSQHLMADDNVFIGNYNDSLIHIQKIEKNTGKIILTRTFDPQVKLSIPDTGRYLGEAVFYPSQDTGFIVFYSRSYIGNSVNDPGSYSSIIKLDKYLNIQWSLFCKNTEKIYISATGIASDVSGATYLSYMNLNDTTFGICKVGKSGSIIADKQSAEKKMWGTGYTSIYGSLIALQGNRLMVISQSGHYSTVLDTALNVIRSYQFSFGGALMTNFAINTRSKSVYKQSLIAAKTSRFSSYKSSYYLMDTTGRLLKIDTSSHSENLLEISINENNHLVMCTYAPLGSGYNSRLQTIDTSGRVLFVRGFSNIFNGSSILLSGKNAYWLSYDNIYKSNLNNLMCFENSTGNGFCEGSSDVTSLIFDGRIPVKNDIMPKTVLKNGNFKFEKGYLDTLSSLTSISILVCEVPAGIKTEQIQHINVFKSGREQLDVIVPEEFGHCIFELIDITGRQIQSSRFNAPKTTIQLSYPTTGIYIWKMYSSNGKRAAGKVFIE